MITLFDENRNDVVRGFPVSDAVRPKMTTRSRWTWRPVSVDGVQLEAWRTNGEWGNFYVTIGEKMYRFPRHVHASESNSFPWSIANYSAEYALVSPKPADRIVLALGNLAHTLSCDLYEEDEEFVLSNQFYDMKWIAGDLSGIKVVVDWAGAHMSPLSPTVSVSVPMAAYNLRGVDEHFTRHTKEWESKLRDYLGVLSAFEEEI